MQLGVVPFTNLARLIGRVDHQRTGRASLVTTTHYDFLYHYSVCRALSVGQTHRRTFFITVDHVTSMRRTSFRSQSFAPFCHITSYPSRLANYPTQVTTTDAISSDPDLVESKGQLATSCGSMPRPPWEAAAFERLSNCPRERMRTNGLQ